MIDAYGRTIQSIDMFHEESTGTFPAMHMMTTPVRSVNTIYPMIGDVVGNLMLVLSAGLLIGLWFSRKRVAKAFEAGTVLA